LPAAPARKSPNFPSILVVPALRTPDVAGVPPRTPIQDKGFSFLEVFIVVAIILILAAIEIPNLWRARMAANQAAAAASMRAIQTAEAVYAATYGNGYTTQLSQLGPPGSGTPSTSIAAGLLDKLLAGGSKGGYRYIYIPGPVTDGKISSFTVKAVPAAPCETGFVSYTVNSSDPTSISAQTFQTVTQSDPVAQVLGQTLGGNSTCTGP
jgi:prepilin-type N-terminal cleavage/methylation domain-containing protein